MPNVNEIVMPAPYRVEVRRGGDVFLIEQNAPIDPSLLLEIAGLVLQAAPIPPEVRAAQLARPSVEVFNPRSNPRHRAQYEEAQAARQPGDNSGAR